MMCLCTDNKGEMQNLKPNYSFNTPHAQQPPVSLFIYPTEIFFFSGVFSPFHSLFPLVVEDSKCCRGHKDMGLFSAEFSHEPSVA